MRVLILEQRALDLVASRLGGVFGPRAGTRALDAGCGEGRLLPWIATFAAGIVALDADPGRLAVARKQAANLPGTDLTLVNGTVAELTGEPFDLVVCSHVIQHVATTELPGLLSRLHALTAPGGRLLISYRRALSGERFGVRTFENGGIADQALDREQFDALVAQPSGTSMLPVHELDPALLAELARGIGWTETWSWTYHVLDDLGVVDDHTDRDELVNSTPALRRALGDDMMALWRRD